MSMNINQVQRVHSRDEMDGVRIPGAFTAFDDHTAIFCGNGSTSAEQATDHFIRFEGKSDPVLKNFVDSRAASTYGAQLMLQANQHLKSLKPTDAIPEGQLFEMSAMTLKTALAQFKDRLPELEALVTNMTASGTFDVSDGMSKAIGGASTRTMGRTLPVR